MNKERKKRALVICAHDDDEVIGPGGSIRKLSNAGVEVTTVIFATGNEGYQKIEDKETIVEDRAKERRAAGDILGTLHCITHDYGDFTNLDCENVYQKVIQAVRSVRPDLIFSHLPTDYLAHRTLSKLVPEAVWQAGWKCSLELGEPWKVDRLYMFPILEFVAKPSHIIDISDTLEAKIEAMCAYRSQHEVVPGILDQIEAKARAYGSLIGVRYGEAFIRSQAIPIGISDTTHLFEAHV
jgi:LmbE family N-acetylglucosaminyl deacetylase